MASVDRFTGRFVTAKGHLYTAPAALSWSVNNKRHLQIPAGSQSVALRWRPVDASAGWRDVTSELLRVLEAVAEDPVQYARREGYMLHMFALYLLAQFRERRAYPLVVTMFRAPGEIPFDLVGDTVTETLNRILASVYDGDPGPLQTLRSLPTKHW